MKNDESMLPSHGQHPPFVITVGRQFGSGGRVLAKALAESLGIAYYDKELLVESAKHAGVNPEFLRRRTNASHRSSKGFSASRWVSHRCATTLGHPQSVTTDSIKASANSFSTHRRRNRLS